MPPPILSGEGLTLWNVHQAGWWGLPGFFMPYDWTDSTAKDLSSQPVALLPGCALSPCSAAAICRPWWMGR